MSNRIALMVRGLPSIGIDEAVERFGKYYPEPKSGVFHESDSFIGRINGDNVNFVNKKTGDYEGGQGLNKQTIGDLRKLRKDFENYASNNPRIYTNRPTSSSRASIYRRIGFKNIGERELQVLDARRIADRDILYVNALDKSLLPYGIGAFLNPKNLEAFIKKDDIIVAASKLRTPLTNIVAAKSGKESLDEAIKDILARKRARQVEKQNLIEDDYFVGEDDFLEPEEFIIG